jgi:hypothetical protein
MMARTPEDLGALMRDPLWLEPRVANTLWTDDFSNVLNVLDLSLF